MSDNNNAIPSQYLTDDELVRVIDLQRGSFKPPHMWEEVPAFQLKPLTKKRQELWLQPVGSVSRVLDYLMQQENLSNLASIRVEPIDVAKYGLTGTAGVRVRGVSFEHAVEIALRERFITSIFYAEEPGIYEWGVPAYLVVYLGKRKEANNLVTLHLQAWQGSDSSDCVYYIHAIFPDNMLFCKHLDGAVMNLNPNAKKELFYNGIYLKNPDTYKKQFRLDGEIPLHSFYEIVKRYFLTDTLTDEYFDPTNIYFKLDGIQSNGSFRNYKVSLG